MKFDHFYGLSDCVMNVLWIVMLQSECYFCWQHQSKLWEFGHSLLRLSELWSSVTSRPKSAICRQASMSCEHRFVIEGKRFHHDSFNIRFLFLFFLYRTYYIVYRGLYSPNLQGWLGPIPSVIQTPQCPQGTLCHISPSLQSKGSKGLLNHDQIILRNMM